MWFMINNIADNPNMTVSISINQVQALVADTPTYHTNNGLAYMALVRNGEHTLGVDLYNSSILVRAQ